MSLLWSLQVGEVGGEMLAQDVADPAALAGRGDAEALEQILLALGRHAVDLPALDEPLVEELDRTMPRVVGRPALVVQRRRVLTTRERRHRAPQREDVSVRIAIVGGCRRDPSRGTVSLAHCLQASGP